MPCFRGVQLSIVAASDHSVFPEFPHPDGSSVRLGGLQSSRNSSSVFHSPRRPKRTEGHRSDDAQRHADPKISVYIPSAPDTNFYFRYVINQAPVGHKYMFFRVAINGRQVVSWGVDLSKTLVGAAHQALFEPSSHYQYNDNGVLMTQYGIESRCFRFVTYGSGEASIANDGGLIEVQVFRAKSRARRAPQPDPYRGGDKYGVALISNGLLENPQMASFFDYHLTDPKDAPYASFRFHYRSWDNLRLLHLAHCEKPDFLCASPSKVSSSEVPKKTDNIGFNFSIDTESHGKGAQCVSKLCFDSQEQGDSGLLVSNFSNIGIARLAVPGKERPLPALPTTRKTSTSSKAELMGSSDDQETPEAEGTHRVACSAMSELSIQRVRGVSEASKCSAKSNISIAKSLQEYADGEDGLLVDIMELGSAIKLKTIFHGKVQEKTSPGGRRYECSNMSGDDVFLSARSSPCSEEGHSLISIQPLALSPTKKRTKPRRIYVAPFTDSLRKREVAAIPRSPTHRHIRGASYDSSSKIRTSSKQKRPHGGSLDFRYQRILGRDHILEGGGTSDLVNARDENL